jgi:hypothetical protein
MTVADLIAAWDAQNDVHDAEATTAAGDALRAALVEAEQKLAEVRLTFLGESDWASVSVARLRRTLNRTSPVVEGVDQIVARWVPYCAACRDRASPGVRHECSSSWCSSSSVSASAGSEDQRSR